MMTLRLCRFLLGGVSLLAAAPAWAQAPAPAFAEEAVAEEMDAPFFVTWAGASVRSAPNGTAEIAETLPFGAQAIVTGRLATGGWVRVQTPNTPIGYMWAETLAPMRVTLPGIIPATSPSAMPGPAVPPEDGPADDSPAAATPLGSIGATPLTATGRVSPSDAADVYSLTTEGWTRLSADLTGMTGDADIELRDAGGSALASSDNGGSADDRIVALVGPGTYQLVVTSYEDETPYSLAVSGTPGEAPPPDAAGPDPASAADLGDATGTRLEARERVGLGDDGDTFAFRIRERQTVRVALTGLSADADIDLTDAASSHKLSSSNIDDDPELLVATLDPGTYYVTVSPEEGLTDYLLAVTAAAAAPIPPDAAGDTPGRAGVIEGVGAAPVVIHDWVGFSDRGDYWRFTLTEPADVSVLMTMETSDADIALLRASDQETLIESSNTSIDPEELRGRLDPGTYLLWVDSYQGDAPYALEIRAVPAK